MSRSLYLYLFFVPSLDSIPSIFTAWCVTFSFIHYLLLYYYSLTPGYFLRRVKNGVEQAGSRGVEELGGIEGETTNQDILWEKYLFSIKGEKHYEVREFLQGIRVGCCQQFTMIGISIPEYKIGRVYTLFLLQARGQ